MLVSSHLSKNRMKIVSWNVNGIRSVIRKGALEEMISSQTYEDADIICLQEIRCDDKIAENALIRTDFPWTIWACSQLKKGYAGTAILSRKEPINMRTIDLIDNLEGRVTCAEFENFTLINTYTPTAGTSRFEYRIAEWDTAFKKMLIDESNGGTTNLIVCGDFNVAHKNNDYCPLTVQRASNPEQVSGLTIEERDNFSDLITSCDLFDAYRFYHPLTTKYTWWSNFRPNKNTELDSKKIWGWRIDYFLVSQNMANVVKGCDIDEDQKGSDHVPIWLEL